MSSVVMSCNAAPLILYTRAYAPYSKDVRMKFSEIVKQAVALLQDSKRISYRSLKIEFDISDNHLAALKDERPRERSPSLSPTRYDEVPAPCQQTTA